MFKDFDTKWDDVLLPFREAPNNKILESKNKYRLTDSEQLKTTFALYNQDTALKNEPTSHTRWKNMIKRYLDQATKDRHFDARNNRIASGAPIRRKTEDRSKTKTGKHEIVNERPKERAPRECRAVSNKT